MKMNKKKVASKSSLSKQHSIMFHLPLFTNTTVHPPSHTYIHYIYITENVSTKIQKKKTKPKQSTLLLIWRTTTAKMWERKRERERGRHEGTEKYKKISFVCRHTAASYDYMQPAKKNVLITNVCCCSTRLHGCIGAHRAHILPQMNDLNWKLFFSSFFPFFLSSFKSSKLQSFALQKNIFFCYFFLLFSALFLFLVNENFCQFSWNFHKFKALLLSHSNWTHTYETEWRKWQKKSFFFHHLHSSELEHHYICEIYIKNFLYI